MPSLCQSSISSICTYLTIFSRCYAVLRSIILSCYRLVVIADKDKVHTQFPIPLINRLEKHYISATSLLDENQRKVKRELENWAEKFVTPLQRDGHGYVSDITTLPRCIKTMSLTLKFTRVHQFYHIFR